MAIVDTSTTHQENEMSKQTMTQKIAYAIGRDAGNKSMRAAGRTVWAVADFNAASKAMEAAMLLITA